MNYYIGVLLYAISLAIIIGGWNFIFKRIPEDEYASMVTIIIITVSAMLPIMNIIILIFVIVAIWEDLGFSPVVLKLANKRKDKDEL